MCVYNARSNRFDVWSDFEAFRSGRLNLRAEPCFFHPLANKKTSLTKRGQTFGDLHGCVHPKGPKPATTEASSTTLHCNKNKPALLAKPQHQTNTSLQSIFSFFANFTESPLPSVCPPIPHQGNYRGGPPQTVAKLHLFLAPEMVPTKI